MDYIAILEYEHLDNGMFLNSFARALSTKKSRGIILHSDSEYTERIIQTGVMREEATIRAMKDLNHRLVALLADQGVPVIAVNGYQKSLVRIAHGSVTVDLHQLKNFPAQPVILISGLAIQEEDDSIVPVPLPELALSLKNSLNINKEITVFSIHEVSEIIRENLPEVVNPDELEDDFKNKHLPENFRDFHHPLRLTSTQNFAHKE